MKIKSEEYSRDKLFSFLNGLEDGFVSIYIASKSQGYVEKLKEEIPDYEKLKEAVYKVRSETGFVIFWGENEKFIIVPPFPVKKNKFVSELDITDLQEIYSRKYNTGVILLRLGEYSVGVFENKKLLASKTGTRYVKGRHRAGGQSAPRFARIRERQVQELFKEVCEHVREKFKNLDYVFLGGEKQTLKSFIKNCKYLEKFKIPERVLNVRHMKKKALEKMPEEIWKSKVYKYNND